MQHAKAQCTTIPLKLLKIVTRILITVRKARSPRRPHTPATLPKPSPTYGAARLGLHQLIEPPPMNTLAGTPSNR